MTNLYFCECFFVFGHIQMCQMKVIIVLCIVISTYVMDIKIPTVGHSMWDTASVSLGTTVLTPVPM